MCSFIILLLLLGRNCGCSNSCNSSCNNNCNNSYRDYSREGQNDCDCDREEWNAGDYARSKEHHHKKENRSCGCSACECGQPAEESPIVEREDIWTSYKKTSSGKACQ